MLGAIAERGDSDDARGYPDPRHEVMLIERHARLAGRDVLEVGCGNGRLTLEYAARARRVVAIEPDGATIREGRRRARARGLSKIRFRTQPAQTGIRGGPFDVVLFSYSLCWIAQEGMVDALRSAWRVLRARGLVVLLQPSSHSAPRLAVARDKSRTELGVLTRTPDPDVLAAHRARRRAVTERWFSIVTNTHAMFRARYPTLADVRWVVRQNPNLRIGATHWRRLSAAMSRRPRGEVEIRRAYSLTVLRKRA